MPSPSRILVDRSRMKHSLFWSMFGATLICAGILLVEAALRMFFPQPLGAPAFAYHPKLGAIPTPNQRAVRWLPGDGSYLATNDSSGLRQTNIINAEAPRLRILFLGDSFTYGTGVNDAEAFPALVEGAIPGAKAWNAGNPGTGTDYALKFFPERGASFAADWVVLGFFANDFADNGGDRYFRIDSQGNLSEQDVSQTFAYFREKEGLSSSLAYIWLAERSHALSLFRRWLAWRKLAAGSLGIGALLRPDEPSFQPFAEGIANAIVERLTAIYLSELQKKAKSLGSQFMVVYLPNPIDLRLMRAQKSLGKDEAVFQRIAVAKKIPSLSLTKAFHDSGKSEAELFLRDGHFTKAGHEIAGREIAAASKRRDKL